MVMTESINV